METGRGETQTQTPGRSVRASGRSDRPRNPGRETLSPANRGTRRRAARRHALSAVLFECSLCSGRPSRRFPRPGGPLRGAPGGSQRTPRRGWYEAERGPPRVCVAGRRTARARLGFRQRGGGGGSSRAGWGGGWFPRPPARPLARHLARAGAPGPRKAPRPEAGRSRRAHREALRHPLMILPQVHLRKPCYDFYFL